ncbi:MAG: tRNA (N(6)-L-threonylcarbamoyladenosine(37)-C(2))-methylthiotransferase MtaB, partial [Nitrospinaceae bacterium]
MKVAFTTLGCRTNQNDTAEMQTVLQDEGFIIVDARDRADIYVINTCTVTAKSDAGSRQAVKKALAINADALVVFTGCYAQTQPEEAAALPGMDIVLGNANKLQIASVIKKKLDFFRREDDFGLPLIHMSDINSHWDFKPIPVSKFQGRTKAFIKVQTGCGEACTFCTVTWARGQSLSDSRDNV